MIRIESEKAFGFYLAVETMHKRMDNPKDRFCKPKKMYNAFSFNNEIKMLDESYSIYQEDIEILKKMIKASNGKCSLLNFIHVSVDITATREWWHEFNIASDKLRVFNWHNIGYKEEFTKSDFDKDYKDDDSPDNIIDVLNWALKRYHSKDCKLDEKNELLIYINDIMPNNYIESKYVEMDYSALLQIHRCYRKSNMNEWQTFTKWIEDLPYMKEFLGAIYEEER